MNRTHIFRRVSRSFFLPRRDLSPGVLAVFLVIALASSPGPCSAKAATKEAPFHPGEKFVYRASWGMLTAGDAVIEVLPYKTYKDVRTYHFMMETKTNAVVDLIYKIRERQDAYPDVQMSRTLYYSKKATGEHPRDVVVTFDWEKMTATYTNFGQAEKPVPIRAGTFDPLSLFFVVRLYPMKEGDVLEIPVTDGKKMIATRARVDRREKLVIDGKPYDTYLIIPEMERLEKVFGKEKEPDMMLWYTADEKKLPVKIQTKVAVGSFVFELISATD
ncbi:MAG TPA: DUF3108 domain-containing protein [Syntrophales bacterium]|nr:DUF3108 domain-containing protein [Syntrophales bacterium]HOX94089.1 DUF3108 domain-containing protein [Syntrophales bacterium]HPI58011.1 DUF3108 domain-containing protein [Syntrophales bacterium]HPN25861.1 DUF3108 domain-containing protein [Syntrophales bacterium]HQM29583.1 DUF3108 domain-containing protein [Syntrophales bacterium]